MSSSTVVDLISAKKYWQQEKYKQVVRQKLMYAYGRGYSSQENEYLNTIRHQFKRQGRFS